MKKKNSKKEDTIIDSINEVATEIENWAEWKKHSVVWKMTIVLHV